MLKRALQAFRSDELSSEEGIGWLWLACRTAMDLWDDESWFVLSARQVQLARDAGALAALPLALNLRAGIHLFAGQFAAAETLSEEAHAVSDAIANPDVPHARAVPRRLARPADGDATADRGRRPGRHRRGEGRTIGVVRYATAVLYNGLGRYDDALAAAGQATEYPQDLAFYMWGLVELIEAAARSGKAELAADGLRRLSEKTRASRTDWALGVEAQSRALVSEDDVVEPLFREAIERLGRTRVRVALARTHLLYGEWLRRERRRLDAREQLRPPTRYSLSSAWRRSPSAPGSSSRRPASTRANGASRRAMTSPPRKHRSPASRRRVPRIKRSPRSCSSARAPSTITSAKRSASSE